MWCVLVLVLACKGAPEPAVEAEVSPASSEPAVEPALVEAASEVVTEDAVAGEPSSIEPVAEPAEPAEPPPPFMATPADPAVDPLAFVLGDGSPEHVEVVAVHEHGRRRTVLYKLDLAARWTAGRAEDDPLRVRVDEALDACEDEDGYAYLPCREQAVRSAGIPDDLVLHLAEPDSRAWELAQVELDAKGRARVLARKRLIDHGIAVETDLVETKLKVYDMDGDKRSEVLVVFGFGLPGSDLLETSQAAVGFVLDQADLHVQFATTRNYWWHASDLSIHDKEVETTWLARDENGDGYKDLVVRERTRESYHPGESESASGPATTSATARPCASTSSPAIAGCARSRSGPKSSTAPSWSSSPRCRWWSPTSRLSDGFSSPLAADGPPCEFATLGDERVTWRRHGHSGRGRDRDRRGADRRRGVLLRRVQERVDVWARGSHAARSS